MNEPKIITAEIKSLIIGDKKKDGTPLIDKRGNPYKKIVIKTEPTGAQWVSGFIRNEKDERFSWKVGDTVTIKVEPNGEYLNFILPLPSDLFEERIKSLEDWRKVMEGGPAAPATYEAPDEPDFDGFDIP
jgi:hypothetical protein